MKKLVSIFLILLASLQSISVEAQIHAKKENKSLEKPYNTSENAQEKIDALLLKAKKENKNILIQTGGNWCSWCLLFHRFVQETPEVKQLLDKQYLYYHLNYSKENKNEAVFAKYAPNSNDLGYPFFIILNKKGEVVTVQESGSFEQGKGYNKEKVLAFLQKNSPRK